MGILNQIVTFFGKSATFDFCRACLSSIELRRYAAAAAVHVRVLKLGVHTAATICLPSVERDISQIRLNAG